MSTPTRDRNIQVGVRYNSNDILSQFNYLSELVKRDAAGLALNGFPLTSATAMTAKAAELEALQKSRNLGRGGKAVKRTGESKRVSDAKDWIEQAMAILKNASEDAIKPNADLAAAFKPFVGPVGNDAQQVAERVNSLLALFKSDTWKAVLAPYVPAESDLHSVGAALGAGLPGAKGAKKGAQAQAQVDTADLDELDGVLWYFFKAAIRSGRAFWRKKKDRQRGSEYNLDLLRGVPNAPRRPPQHRGRGKDQELEPRPRRTAGLRGKSTRNFAGSMPRFAGSTPHFAGSTPHFAGSTPHFAGSTPRFAGSTRRFARSTRHFAGSRCCFARSRSLPHPGRAQSCA